MIKQFISDIGNALFPPQCLSCAEILPLPEPKSFCSQCREGILYIADNYCPVCGRPFFSSPAPGHICGDCLEKEPYFAVGRSVAGYESIIRETLHQFKYGHNIAIGHALGSLMADFSFPGFAYCEYSLIIPVPLHIKKLRERGFNQSLILARALTKSRQIPVDFSLLRRQKFTLSQTGLNKKTREDNVKGAFIVSDAKKIAGKKIILVDDVYTTGATLNEGAKTLLKAGAKEVAVLTLARALSDRPLPS